MTHEWQPIETAPKDETVIWLYAEDVCWIGAWSNPIFDEFPGKWRTQGYVPDDMDGARLALTSREIIPTHWQPLPEPPND